MSSKIQLVGSIKKRTKKRHESINAAPLQPPQHTEADANPAAAIDENTPLGDTESQEDPTKDADFAATMGVERVQEEDTHHDAVIVDPTIETVPPKHTIPTAAMGVESVEEEDTHHDVVIVDATIEMVPSKHIVPAAAMGVESVEEEDTQHNTAIVDASIAEPSSVIEEAALTALVEKITTQQHVAPEKNLEESVTRPEEEAPEQELTLRDLPEIQKATSVHKQLVIALALEKPGDKESMAVPREPEAAELTLRDLTDSDEYLHFTPPSFDLLSQEQSQQAEIHGEHRKAAGPVKE
ncbi:hypothetical protein PIB30_072171 [Stylosanthes scabra]|uniref:Uncharacterized protein n=1 Tax=Stylosanthes scabra TaxID=79078 RepID=A0ABU6XMV2_9FABA|nr:hypothetical protein [Stylosanthes scabra]